MELVTLLLETTSINLVKFKYYPDVSDKQRYDLGALLAASKSNLKSEIHI